MKTKMKRVIALLLALLMVFSLAACGGDDDDDDDLDGLDDLSHFGGLGGLFGGGDDEELPTVSKEATPAEAFETIMLGMMDVFKAESQSIGMDLSGAFGMPTKFMSLPTYEMAMTYEFDTTERDDDSGEKVPVHESLEGVFASKTNGTDGMYSFSMSSDGESVDSAVYFTGDNVLVQRADRSEPLVKYVLPGEGDGKSLSGLQPLHRFRAVLSEDHPAWLSGSGWDKYMSNLAVQVQASADVVTTEERTVTAGALEAQGNTYILKLEGDAASEFAYQLRGAWMGDIQMRTVLTMAENGVNSNKNDGYILDQFFDVFNGANPKLSMAVSSVDNVPASMACYLESDGGRFHITIAKLTQGSDETVRITVQVFGVSSPSGGGYNFTIENAKSGKSPVVQDNSQTIYAPDGSERLRYTTHSEFTGNDKGGESNFTYRLENITEGYTVGMESTGVFSHTKSGSKIEAQFSGEVKMVADSSDDDEDVDTVYSYHGTLSADEKEQKLDIPEFIDSSGVTVTSRKELCDVLDPDNDYSSPFNHYEKEGAYTQVLYAFSYMMGS